MACVTSSLPVGKVVCGSHEVPVKECSMLGNTYSCPVAPSQYTVEQPFCTRCPRQTGAVTFVEPQFFVSMQYRTTVAKMLAKQANDPRNPAQFIVTTFHPQIIHETDKVYGVSHQNRISRQVVIVSTLHGESQPVASALLHPVTAAAERFWSAKHIASRVAATLLVHCDGNW